MLFCLNSNMMVFLSKTIKIVLYIRVDSLEKVTEGQIRFLGLVER